MSSVDLLWASVCQLGVPGGALWVRCVSSLRLGCSSCGICVSSLGPLWVVFWPRWVILMPLGVFFESSVGLRWVSVGNLETFAGPLWALSVYYL